MGMIRCQRVIALMVCTVWTVWTVGTLWAIGIVCYAADASAGTPLYTGTIQIRADYGYGYITSFPFGAKFSYPKMNNLPTGDYATTIANSPIGVRIPANQMALATSLSTSSPPTSWNAIRIRTVFGGYNGTGSFSPGGAPGSATSAPVTSALGSGFRVSFSGTPTRFGGTMRLLANFNATYVYPSFVAWKVALDFGAVGGEFGGKRTVMDSVFQGTAGFQTFFTETVWGFPWTTGTVVATAPPGPYLGSTARISAMGSDLRTPQGSGKLQLVTPFVIRQRETTTGSLFSTGAGIAIVSLHFVPEPSAIAQLAAGLSILTALYRVSNRKTQAPFAQQGSGAQDSAPPARHPT